MSRGGVPVFDLDSLCRYIDGSGDGVKAFDVGAYEYGRRAPSAKATVSSPSAVVGQAVSFVGSGSDQDAGDKLFYNWSFSDGSTIEDQTVAKAFSAPGSYTGTLTVTDPTGLKATAVVTVQVLATPNNQTTGGSGSSSSSGQLTAGLSDRRPSSKISRPAKASLKKGKTKALKGTARDDKRVVRVDISIVRKVRKGRKTLCYAVTAAGKSKRYKATGRSCKPRYLIRAKGTTKWTVAFKRGLPKGKYTVSSRAKDSKGQLERAGKYNQLTFTVR